MVEEGPPGWAGRFAGADHVLADSGLLDVDAELEKLAVNPGSAPEGEQLRFSGEPVKATAYFG